MTLEAAQTWISLWTWVGKQATQLNLFFPVFTSSDLPPSTGHGPLSLSYTTVYLLTLIEPVSFPPGPGRRVVDVRVALSGVL